LKLILFMYMCKFTNNFWFLSYYSSVESNYDHFCFNTGKKSSCDSLKGNKYKLFMHWKTTFEHEISLFQRLWKFYLKHVGYTMCYPVAPCFFKAAFITVTSLQCGFRIERRYTFAFPLQSWTDVRVCLERQEKRLKEYIYVCNLSQFFSMPWH